MSYLRLLIRGWSRRRFACLFVSLVLTLGAAPVLEALGWDLDLLEGFLALNLAAAVLGAARGRGSWWLLSLSAGALVVMAARAMLGAAALLTAGQAAWSLAALLAVVSILPAVLRRGPVDVERICAALSIYLLFGIVCGVVYHLFEQAWPGSLASAARPPGEALALHDAIYFSFVTLATLGYGDVLPGNLPTRAVAIVEAIGGQFYLVVLVARLVSLYGERPRGDRP